MAFGSDPFASTPFAAGFYAPPAPAGNPKAAKCRVLGTDGDYELDDDGNIGDAADPVDEEIYWRLATVAGSYAGDLQAGNGVTRILVATTASKIAIVRAAKLALEPMRARGVLSSVDIVAETISEQGTTRAAYRVDATKTGLVR